MLWREDVARRAAQDLVGRLPQKFLDCGANHDGAAVASEQEEAVFETAEHLVKIFAKGAKDGPDSAQLLADFADLGAHLSVLVGALERLLVKLTVRNTIQ